MTRAEREGVWALGALLAVRLGGKRLVITTGVDAISGKACKEAWSLYPIPGPTFQNDSHVKSDNNYYMFIDKYNALGLGKDEVIADGANSDSLIGFNQETKQWTRMRVPYRMGFFSRFFDTRIDNANGGWKGRGAYASNETRGSWLTEGGKGTPSQLWMWEYWRHHPEQRCC